MNQTHHLGKTTFALSLPGIVNHIRGRWNVAEWNDNATYMVIDDIPWDGFRRAGFPLKKDLLSGCGQINVSVFMHR